MRARFAAVLSLLIVSLGASSASATTADLSTTRIELSTELFFPDRTLRGRVESGAFGGGVPAEDLVGSTGSDSNAAVLPSVAVLYRADSSRAILPTTTPSQPVIVGRSSRRLDQLPEPRSETSSPSIRFGSV